MSESQNNGGIAKECAFSCSTSEETHYVQIAGHVIGVYLDPGASLPDQGYADDAGHDLYALEDVDIPHGCMDLVRTGVHLDLPDGIFAQINTRSSYGKRGIMLHHGVIDSGYTGEISVWMMNLARHIERESRVQSSATISVKRGDKIGQLLFHKVEHAELKRIDKLPVKERGDKGHGSTGR